MDRGAAVVSTDFIFYMQDISLTYKNFYWGGGGGGGGPKIPTACSLPSPP